MRAMLFLLIGFGLACLIGLATFDASDGRIEEAPADVSSALLPRLLPCLLVLGSWATLLVRGPHALRVVLAFLVVGAGLLAVLAGAFVAYWDHHMRPGETAGWWGIGVGVLMLLSQVAAARRPVRRE